MSSDISRHLYAMRSLIQKELQRQSNGSNSEAKANGDNQIGTRVPAIFSDAGYGLLGTSVLSTSNCGNPALRLFGFGPVTPEGYGIGKSSHITHVDVHRIHHQR